MVLYGDVYGIVWYSVVLCMILYCAVYGIVWCCVVCMVPGFEAVSPVYSSRILEYILDQYTGPIYFVYKPRLEKGGWGARGPLLGVSCRYLKEL